MNYAAAIEGLPTESVASNVAYHAKYTAGVTGSKMSKLALYRAAAASVQERLIDRWDATFEHFEKTDPKMVRE